jgi:hypothetical protein
MTLQQVPDPAKVQGTDTTDYREQLANPRWGKAIKGGRLPEMANPEMNPTSTGRAVAFWLVLGIVTFAIIVAGYTVNLWSFTG